MHIKLIVGLALLAIPVSSECHPHHSYQPLGTYRLSSRGVRYRVNHPEALPGYPGVSRRYQPDPAYSSYRYGQPGYSGAHQYRTYYPAVDHTRTTRKQGRQGK